MYEDEIALPVWRQHPSRGEPAYETLPTQEDNTDDEEHDCSDADRPCDDCLTRALPDHMGPDV